MPYGDLHEPSTVNKIHIADLKKLPRTATSTHRKGGSFFSPLFESKCFKGVSTGHKKVFSSDLYTTPPPSKRIGYQSGIPPLDLENVSRGKIDDFEIQLFGEPSKRNEECGDGISELDRNLWSSPKPMRSNIKPKPNDSTFTNGHHKNIKVLTRKEAGDVLNKALCAMDENRINKEKINAVGSYGKKETLIMERLNLDSLRNTKKQKQLDSLSPSSTHSAASSVSASTDAFSREQVSSNVNTSPLLRSQTVDLQISDLNELLCDSEEDSDLEECVTSPWRFKKWTLERSNSLPVGTDLCDWEESEPQNIENIDLQLPSDEKIEFVKGDVLGTGSFGKVFTALNIVSGENYALKAISLPVFGRIRANENKVFQKTIKEYQMVRRFSHPNIAKYIHIQLSNSESATPELELFMELAPYGSLEKTLENFGAFREDLSARYMKQLLEGVRYLHDHRIVHRDIKAANLLLFHGGVLKISDFGTARMISLDLAEEISLSSTDEKELASTLNNLRGSLPWLAPELVRKQKSESYISVDGSNLEEVLDLFIKADGWSAGCVLVEMLTGSRPWSKKNSLQVMLELLGTDAPPPLNQYASDLAIAFLNECCCVDPSQRPSPGELLEHPFL